MIVKKNIFNNSGNNVHWLKTLRVNRPETHDRFAVRYELFGVVLAGCCLAH